MKQALFGQIVGQKPLLSELDFYLENYRTTKVFPNCLLVAERGAGKTSIVEEIARALKKPFHEMLAKDLEDSDALFQHVVIPLLAGKEATVFIDEASLLSESVTHSFLSILNPTKNHKNSCVWRKNGQSYTFDFRKLTFIFATTNPQKIDPDLKDRLKIFTLDQYNTNDLSTILRQRTPKLTYEPGVLQDIAETLRNNPRNAVMRADDLESYCRAHKKRKITKADFSYLRKKLNIMPLGLNKLEVQALKFLSERPLTSLTTLAAKMHMTVAAIQRDVETRLLATNLIEIEARGRIITPEGQAVLLEVANKNKQK